MAMRGIPNLGFVDRAQLPQYADLEDYQQQMAGALMGGNVFGGGWDKTRRAMESYRGTLGSERSAAGDFMTAQQDIAEQEKAMQEALKTAQAFITGGAQQLLPWQQAETMNRGYQSLAEAERIKSSLAGLYQRAMGAGAGSRFVGGMAAQMPGQLAGTEQMFDTTKESLGNVQRASLLKPIGAAIAAMIPGMQPLAQTMMMSTLGDVGRHGIPTGNIGAADLASAVMHGIPALADLFPSGGAQGAAGSASWMPSLGLNTSADYMQPLGGVVAQPGMDILGGLGSIAGGVGSAAGGMLGGISSAVENMPKAFQDMTGMDMTQAINKYALSAATPQEIIADISKQIAATTAQSTVPTMSLKDLTAVATQFRPYTKGDPIPEGWSPLKIEGRGNQLYLAKVGLKEETDPFKGLTTTEYELKSKYYKVSDKPFAGGEQVYVKTPTGVKTMYFNPTSKIPTPTTDISEGRFNMQLSQFATDQRIAQETNQYTPYAIGVAQKVISGEMSWEDSLKEVASWNIHPETRKNLNTQIDRAIRGAGNSSIDFSKFE